MCLRIRIAPESLAWRYGNVLATGFILTPKETKIMDRGGVGSPGSGDGMTSILKKRTEVGKLELDTLCSTSSDS
ncbi:uncharacterized protein PADG_11107 [Paracoccidioides brasiliensis Pb18]|uniref:Uncharacterized protein n=1 Tax=Paracoccidioides brasiliensis (strain Pb18) TaxID=502780 RepID=A0A0A0HTZ4_PARBD|nr:uncharacterized protein PADG_11107 [Paracoccidioides brasiliensis Pb18]KGM92654.1 hypothetical protein PADG_11107 [Paracoccidioides brasiliensis Pb18]